MWSKDKLAAQAKRNAAIAHDWLNTELSAIELAFKYGVSASTVNVATTRRGLPSKFFTNDAARKAAREWLKGKSGSFSDVAKKYGLNRNQVAGAVARERRRAA